jgi:DNA-directed RNA polymerase subunit beta
VYFERNRNQKKRNQFKRKLSTDINKLRAFLPSGEAFISELDLFFPTPVTTIDRRTNKKKVIPHWKKTSIFSYSINFLKQKQKNSTFYFLQCFKLYRIISTSIGRQQKIELIQLFLKWLKLKNNISSFKSSLKEENIFYLLEYFNLLIRLLIKYEIFQKIWVSTKIEKKSVIETEKKWLQNIIQTTNSSSLQNLFQLSTDQTLKLLDIYDKSIVKSQKTAHIQLNRKLILIANNSKDWLNEMRNFYFLKQSINQLTQKVKEVNQGIEFKELRPTIYFSTSLKEQLKYIFGKNKLLYKPDRHKYIKTKTQLLLYKEDHEIKTNYHKKYDEKDLYTAILIPEYGSWIRFGFQKNTKINPYKYPLKNQEEEITIQLDKVNQKPVLYLLKEMGLTDLEIYRNLEHSDFFYFNKPLLIDSVHFNQPLLRFDLTSNYFNNISEFSRIFDSSYYRLGKVGRLKMNSRLNLKINSRIQTITYEDIFAITDKLLTLTITKTVPDDIDHLKNRRVRSVGELLQNLFRIGFQRLVRKLRNQTNKIESGHLLSFNIVNATVREFFGSSQLSQYLDQTNPLSSLTHRRRISGLGPGGFDRDRISFAVRDIHPSHYGRICPIETPEGQNVGLIASLTTCARVNRSGFLETPFWRVLNGKVIKTGNPIYLTADIEDLYKIAPADIATNPDNYLARNVIPVRYKQDFVNVTPSEVDFIAVSPIQVVSVAASLIPFFEHDDANRALMGSNMQRQSVPLILPQKPIVGTGLENQIAIDSGMTLNAQVSGIVNSVTANKIIVKDKIGKKRIYQLQKYLRSNQQTCINHRPIVWKGEKVKSGQILTDGPAITSGELALGQNVLVGYMPWQGYNFEDAILINERLVYDDIFTSIHIERYKIEIDRTSDLSEQTTKNIPNLSPSEIHYLNDDGIVTVGTFVKPGDILVGKVISNDTSEQLPESKLLRAIFGAKAKGVKDSSYRMPDGEYGRVIETVTFNRRTKLTYKFEKIYVFIAQIRKIQVGDKIAGRHGNKGIISRILPRQDMPFLPDGTPIDIILNPLGVPSRMNVGQLYECLLGLAGDKLNSRFKILPFDEMYGLEMSRILINKKLRQASILNDESWLFNPYAPGKMVLIDGRTGKEFENPITVGNAYMLKLIHLVDDKMHARATGPYSLITQQPLRGKAQHGGQRFGEMEVWALEGFGAAFTLKELLTIKSDDMQGRNETLNAIVKGQQIPKFGIPESFKVLLQELRSIGLDMSTYKIEKFSSYKKYEVEVNLIEKYNAFSKTFSPTSNINDISF